VTVHVGVRLVAGTTATTGRRAWRSAIAVVDIATRRRVVIDRRRTSATRRRSVAVIAGVVVVARWRGTTAVVITARAVATRRTAAIVVVIRGRTTMSAVSTIATTTVARGARAVTGLTRTRDLGLRVGDAVDGNSLEVVLVELLNGRLEIGSSLVLDETLATGAGSVALTVDLTVDDVETGLAGEVFQILPAGLERKPGDRHTMNGATRARSHAFLSEARAIARAGAATRELDDQTLAHELGAMEGRHDVTRVHCIFVLDEAKAVHELDLGDLASAMGVEVVLNIGLGSIAREVAKVEASIGGFSFGLHGYGGLSCPATGIL